MIFDPLEEWIQEVTESALPEVQTFMREINLSITHGEKLELNEAKTKAMVERCVRNVVAKRPDYRANIIAKLPSTDSKAMASLIVSLVKAYFKDAALSASKDKA